MAHVYISVLSLYFFKVSIRFKWSLNSINLKGKTNIFLQLIFFYFLEK